MYKNCFTNFFVSKHKKTIYKIHSKPYFYFLSYENYVIIYIDVKLKTENNIVYRYKNLKQNERIDTLYEKSSTSRRKQPNV